MTRPTAPLPSCRLNEWCDGGCAPARCSIGRPECAPPLSPTSGRPRVRRRRDRRPALCHRRAESSRRVIAWSRAESRFQGLSIRLRHGDRRPVGGRPSSQSGRSSSRFGVASSHRPAETTPASSLWCRRPVETGRIQPKPVVSSFGGPRGGYRLDGVWNAVGIFSKRQPWTIRGNARPTRDAARPIG